MDLALKNPNNQPGLSGPGSNSYEGTLHILQSCRTEALPSVAIRNHTRTLMG